MSKKIGIGESLMALIARLAGGVGKKANLRRHWFIYPSFQGRVIAFGLGISAVGLILIYLALMYFFRHCVTVLLGSGLSGQHPVFRFLEEQEHFMSVIFIFVLVMSVAISVIVGIFFSHRVAGPLYGLRKQLDAIAAGAPPKPIQFRKNDYFQEIATSFNAAFAKNAKERSSRSSAK